MPWLDTVVIEDGQWTPRWFNPVNCLEVQWSRLVILQRERQVALLYIPYHYYKKWPSACVSFLKPTHGIVDVLLWLRYQGGNFLLQSRTRENLYWSRLQRALAQVWWFGGLFGGFLGPEDSMMLVIPTANWNSMGDVMAWKVLQWFLSRNDINICLGVKDISF